MTQSIPWKRPTEMPTKDFSLNLLLIEADDGQIDCHVLVWRNYAAGWFDESEMENLYYFGHYKVKAWLDVNDLAVPDWVLK